MDSADEARVIATFVVPGEPRTVEGILKQVYHDLKSGNKDADIELREISQPYIRIEAPTEEDALVLIRTARRLADSHLSGTLTDQKLVFVELPASFTTTNFRIAVQAIDAAKNARPVIEIVPGTPDATLESSSDRYKQIFSENLCTALQEASNLHASVILHVQLGYYLLQSYKPGKYTPEQFDDMVKHPRATGYLETCLGKAPYNEGLSVKAIMRLIRESGSPCVPIDNQTPTSADVTPTYIFECWHDGNRYETQVEMSRTKQGITDGHLKFELNNTTVVPKDAQVPRFEATSISLGRKLDWKIAAMPGDDKVGVSSTIKQYLSMGHTTMQGPHHDIHCYPVTSLPENHTLANKLKSVAMKSIYRFSWKGTGYVVQFTINRRWQSIREMNRKTPKDTDFNVIIYADNWERDSRVPAGKTVGKIWGSDLQGLLRDETGGIEGCASSRVQGLIETILDIRDFFDSCSQVQE
ncbi:hypothetical protein SAMD00023353_4600800 [Rosellinia necatrix]|uniref:Uncharacterized protein n=1 Tax=Rosellinia necatrix TaxID=77044 RepID=A0A1W2TPJ3_ROSNE|nr:hypothetical protein SAMD00023353_4600800 [Rosellinia necatrix]